MTKTNLSLPNGKNSQAPVTNITVLLVNIVSSSKRPLHHVLSERKIRQNHTESLSQIIGEYGGQVIKITDGSVVGSFSGVRNAVRSAIEIRQEFGNTPKTKSGQSQVCDKIAIHHGKGAVQAEGIFDSVLKLAEKMVLLANENEIYISKDVYNLVHNLPDVNFSPVKFIDKKSEFIGINIYKINHSHKEEKQHFFSHQDALIHGDEPPCFYCGNCNHLAPKCPSKNILHIADSLEEAGYLHPEKLNNLFADYVSDDGSESNGSKKRSYSLAKDIFFETKLIYQLRFLRAIWGWENLDWEKLREKKKGREKSGPIWQVFDSVCSSNLPKAKELLEQKTLEARKNHKLFIVLAIIEIEQNDFPLALKYLNHALDATNKKPQKIFILFLLARIYELTGKSVRTKQNLREILLHDPQCPEALYDTMVLDFSEQRTKRALLQLVKLVKQNREYYIKALIDPDLAPFRSDIHPRLESLFDEAKAEADQLVPMAEKELGILKNLVLDKDEQWLDKAHSLWDQIKDLSGSEGYLSYLDKVRFATELLSIGEEVKEDRKRNIRKIVYELRPRCEKYFTFVVNFSYSMLIGDIPKQLTAIHSELAEIERSVRSNHSFNYKKIISRLKGLSSELTVIYSTIQKRNKTILLLQLIFFMLKFNMIFQGITLLIVFVGLPVLNHYAALIGVPGQELLAQHIGPLSKWALVMSVMFWGCISFIWGLKKIYGNHDKGF
jgi:hypothetical protein